MKPDIRGFWYKPWHLALLSGILLGFSFPPFDLPILQIPALIMLFRLTELSSSWRDLAVKGFTAFLIWNLITTYWLMMATPAGGLAAIIANSMLMIIPLIAIRSLLQIRLHPFIESMLAGSIWVTYEYLHHNWELAWPWLALANGWSNMTDAIQYISVTGHLGVSFWIVATATISYRTIATLKRSYFIYAVSLLIIFPLFSIFTKIVYQETGTEAFRVAVIQPDMDSYQPFGGLGSTDRLLTNLFQLTDSVRTGQTDLIIWPENAIDTVISRDNRFNHRIRDSLDTWNTELITGAGLVEYYDPGSEPPLYRQDNNGRSYNIYNSAFHFTRNGLPDIYKKGMLVPMVERLPYAEFFRILDPFDWVPWDEIIGYGRGKEANSFQSGESKTAVLVCYDSVFPNWVGAFIKDGAGFITIITNDGWWGDTSGHIQHFSYARLRAIEFRRWVVRSANNGISGIISPDGKVQTRTEYNTRTGFTFDIYPTDRLTFFTKYMNWFNWLMIFGTVISGVLLIFHRSK